MILKRFGVGRICQLGCNAFDTMLSRQTHLRIFSGTFCFEMCLIRLWGEEHNAGVLRYFKTESRVKGSSLVIQGGSAKLYAANLISGNSFFGDALCKVHGHVFTLERVLGKLWLKSLSCVIFG